MIIGVCGFCSTGSSAVSDYLKEFKQNQVLDMFEFTFIHLPDGLGDLEYHLMKNNIRDDSCSIAIPRFRNLMRIFENSGVTKKTNFTKIEIRKITELFINELVQIKWKSTRRTDFSLYNNSFLYRYFGRSLMYQRIFPFLLKNFGYRLNIYPIRDVEFSIKPKNFYKSSKKFVRDILLGFGADFSKNIVLDQPFIGNNPAASFSFFENPKAIVVDRDPRDNYLFSKIFLSQKGCYMPTNNVQDFVKYYKLLRDGQPYKNSNENILLLKFEDMIYNYNSTTNKLNQFLGLPENSSKFTIFDPNISISNTQLFNRFPEYKNDIKYIEKELPEYLFNFQNYPIPVRNGPMFMGKSPLNKF